MPDSSESSLSEARLSEAVRYDTPISGMEIVVCFGSNPMQHQACKGGVWRQKKMWRE